MKLDFIAGLLLKAVEATGAKEYGLDGWTAPDLIDPDDVSVVLSKARR